MADGLKKGFEWVKNKMGEWVQKKMKETSEGSASKSSGAIQPKGDGAMSIPEKQQMRELDRQSSLKDKMKGARVVASSMDKTRFKG